MTASPARLRRLPVLIATIAAIGGFTACSSATAPTPNTSECRPPGDTTSTNSGQGPICDVTQPWY